MTRLSFGVTDEVVGTATAAAVTAAGANKADGANDADDEAAAVFALSHEVALLVHIAAPSVVIQFCLFFIFPAAAGAVGRQSGTTALAAFALGSLLGNLTCLSILEGALTAADTLMPRAYGTHQYRAVGQLAVRGAVVSTALLLLPVAPLWCGSARLLVALRQDAEAAQMAQDWIRIYLAGLPPSIFFRVALRFLLAQHQTWPLVVSSAVPCLVLHPVLLYYLVPAAGLQGSAVAIVLTQWATAFLLVVCLTLRPVHHAETWPRRAERLRAFVLDALQPKLLLEFLQLSVGGIFSMTEWWFFETMCFIAGSFGVVALCVHTIAYNLVPLLFMVPLGILIGLTVRMGHLMADRPRHAKILAAHCMASTSGAGLVAALLLYRFRYAVIASFTNDALVVAGALVIWPNLCAYIVLLYVFGISQAILRALGLQWRLAAIISVCLYCFTLPAVVYFSMVRGGGLPALWTVLPISYCFMQVALAMGYVVVDWDAHAAVIRKGVLVDDTKRVAGENTLLLPPISAIRLEL